MTTLMPSFTARMSASRSDLFPIIRRRGHLHQFANTRLTLLPNTPLTPRRPRITCMAEPYLITKLESAEKTWKELSVKLADPDVVSNPSEYQKLAQSVAELDEVVSTFRSFKDCEKLLEETKAKEGGNDEDMAQMISYEIDSLSKQLTELEEKLKVLLLPSDPLDARNIMLEGIGSLSLLYIMLFCFSADVPVVGIRIM